MLSSLIQHDVLPVEVGYLLVMGALGTGLWLIRRQHGDGAAAGSRQDPEAGAAAGPAATTVGPAATTAGPRAGWLWLARRYAGTAIGGYLLLMAVVILYYYGVVRVGGAFIESAFTGCALLIALATPVFALASWLAERRGARPRTPAGGPHPGSGPGSAGAPPAPTAPS